MSVNHTNIDINDVKRYTNAPFTYACKRQLGDITIPLGYFVSVKVYVTENDAIPFRIAGATSTSLIIVDADNKVIGYWDISKAMSTGCAFIYSDSGIIKGHIVADKNLPVLLKSAVLGKDSIATKSDDFILLPQCHVSMFSGSCKAVVINNEHKYVTGDIILAASNGVLASKKDNDAIAISVYNNKTSEDFPSGAAGNGICVVHISSNYNQYVYNNTDKKHIMLTNTALSNLRTRTTGNTITLKGVKDV